MVNKKHRQIVFRTHNPISIPIVRSIPANPLMAAMIGHERHGQNGRCQNRKLFYRIVFYPMRTKKVNSPPLDRSTA
jgi:hypothetical protein